jgi:hypothetical protein
MWLPRVAGKVASTRAFALLLSLFCLFFISSVVAEDLSGLFLNPLILQVIENMFLFSNEASITLWEVEDSLSNVFLCLFELQQGAIQSVPSAIEASFHCVQVGFHII